MNQPISSVRLVTMLVMVLGLIACVNRPPTKVETDWMQRGETQRQAVIDRFGEPAQYYEGGKVLAYRINTNQVNRGPFVKPLQDEYLTTDKVGRVKRSLIIHFNDKGILEGFKIIKLKGKKS